MEVPTRGVGTRGVSKWQHFSRVIADASPMIPVLGLDLRGGLDWGFE